MNDKKITVHIGPPKTATTSLQFFLQKLDSRNIEYTGVFQPRHKNKERNKIRNNLFSFLTSGKDQKKKKVKAFINEIECQNLILSEEMILHGLNWRKKIRRLSSLLEDYSHVVKVCLRDPKDGIPSYYQEMYERLSPSLRYDYEAFVNSSYGDVYDYESVNCCLQEAGFAEVEWFTFERLIGGQLTIGEFISNCSVDEKDRLISLRKENSSKRSGRKECKVVDFSYIDELGSWSRHLASLVERMGPPGKRLVQKLRHGWKGHKEVRIGFTEREAELKKKYLRFLSSIPA